MHFHKQADKMNHGAHIGHPSQNRSFIINQINHINLNFKFFKKRHRLNYIFDNEAENKM